MSIIRWLYLLPRNLMRGLIVIYRRLLSPLKPACCRFQPTCSAYGLEALKVHGFLKGMVLIVWRLLRCHPFYHGDMYDPVPPRGKWRCESRLSEQGSEHNRE